MEAVGGQSDCFVFGQPSIPWSFRVRRSGRPVASRRGYEDFPPRPWTDSRRRTHRVCCSFPSRWRRWRRWRGHRLGTPAVDPRTRCWPEAGQCPAERSSRTTKTRASRRSKSPPPAGTGARFWRRWSQLGRDRRPPRDTLRHTSSRTAHQMNVRPGHTDPEPVHAQGACGDLWRSAHHRVDSQPDRSSRALPGRRRILGMKILFVISASGRACQKARPSRVAPWF